jgi:hypothetical protein
MQVHLATGLDEHRAPPSNANVLMRRPAPLSSITCTRRAFHQVGRMQVQLVVCLDKHRAPPSDAA